MLYFRTRPLSIVSIVIALLPSTRAFSFTYNSVPHNYNKFVPTKHVPTMSLQFVPHPTVVSSAVCAVAELVTCCGLGSVAAKKGVLSPQNVSALSQLVYNIFLPSLLLVNVAETAMQASIRILLPIPMIAWAQITFGYIASNMFMKLLKIDASTEEGSEIQVCSAFGNSGILPLIFSNALFRGNPDPTLLPRAISYISFFLMGWSPTFWTVGYGTLTKNQPIEPISTSLNGISKAESFIERCRFERRCTIFKNIHSFFTSPRIKRIMSPPILACFLGLLIGVSAPLKWLFVRSDAPFSFIWNSLKLLSQAYTPCGILVLAGSFANAQNEKVLQKSTFKKLAVASIVRWLMLPIATALLLMALLKANFLSRDPVLLFVLMMEACMPPAQNSVIILQVSGLRNSAGRLAKLLCIFYFLGMVPVSIWLSLSLQFCGLF